jgi:hypothetical protein
LAGRTIFTGFTSASFSSWLGRFQFVRVDSREISLLATVSRELVLSEYGDLFASAEESNEGTDGVDKLNGFASLDFMAADANSI